MEEEKIATDVKPEKIGFFEEDPGVKSNGRLLAFLPVFVILLVFVVLNVMSNLAAYHKGLPFEMVEMSKNAMIVVVSSFLFRASSKAIENIENLVAAIGKVVDLIVKIKSAK